MVTNTTLKQELCRCNDRLDAKLSRIGMTVKTYKAIKAMTQLVAVLAASYSLTLGVDPEIPLVVIGAVIVGPEFVEAHITDSDA